MLQLVNSNIILRGDFKEYKFLHESSRWFKITMSAFS